MATFDPSEVQVVSSSPKTFDPSDVEVVAETPATEAKPKSFLRRAYDTAGDAVHAAAGAVPFGHVTGALTEKLVHGGTFRGNYDALERRTAEAKENSPVASVIGETGAGLATLAASGGFAAPGVAAAPSVARAVTPMAANTAIGAGLGAGTAAAEGKGVGDVAKAGLKGATVGAGATLAIPAIGSAAGKVVGKFSKGASEREIGRAAEKVVEGSRGNARKAMPSEDKALHRALAEDPELLAAANSKEPEKVLAAADNLHKKGSSELKEIYKDSNKVPDKGFATNIIAQAEDAELRAVHLERELQGMPQGSEAFKKGKTALDVLRGEANSLRRDAHRQITSSRAPGVDPKQATTNMDVRISELNAGNANDRAVAAKLKTIRDEFHEAVGSKDVIPAEKLRSEQSAYQDIAYSKNPLKDPNLTVSIAAADEAQRAVGDVVVKHVTGMDYKAAKELALANPDSIAGRLFKANERVNVANRIKASIKSKQGGNPNAPHGLRAIAHKAMHSATAVGATAATAMHHPGVGALMVGADAAITAAPHVATAIDKTAIALSRLNNKPASDTIKKYAEKMISLGVATASVDKAVAKLNKEVEPEE